jgi:thiol-disulfide isomerase/thioredoxin
VDLPLGSEWTLIAEPPGDGLRPGRIKIRVPNDRVRIHLPPPDPFVQRDEKEIRLQRASSADPAREGAEWADLPSDDENPLPPAREPEGAGADDPAVLPSSNDRTTWGIPPRFERAPSPEDVLATRGSPAKAAARPSAFDEPEAGKLDGGRSAEPAAKPDRDATPASGGSAQWKDLDWGDSPAPSPGPDPTEPAPPERARTESTGDGGFAEAACDYDPRAERLADFQLPDLDGKPFQLSEAKAELVLLDFWGSWCPPCRASIPHLISLQKRYGPDGLRVVGIAYEEGTLAQGAEAAGKHAREAGVNYPVLLGRERDCPVRTALEVDVYPSLVLLDRSGRILWRGKGATPDTLRGLDRAVADALRQGRTGR